jgi:hypothetical protein
MFWALEIPFKTGFTALYFNILPIAFVANKKAELGTNIRYFLIRGNTQKSGLQLYRSVFTRITFCFLQFVLLGIKIFRSSILIFANKTRHAIILLV